MKLYLMTLLVLSSLLAYEVQGIRLGKVALSASNHQEIIKNQKNDENKHDPKPATHVQVRKEETTSNSSPEYSKHWKKEVITENYPDITDIAGMDYTPARKKSPIHN